MRKQSPETLAGTDDSVAANRAALQTGQMLAHGTNTHLSTAEAEVAFAGLTDSTKLRFGTYQMTMNAKQHWFALSYDVLIRKIDGDLL